MKDETSNRIAPFDAGHQRCWAILPWYVNRTLGAAEAKLVAQHASQCLACRRELELLQALAVSVKSRPQDAQCDAALSRLNARIDSCYPGALVFPWAAAAVLMIACGLVTAVTQSADVLQRTHYRALSASNLEQTTSIAARARLAFYGDITEQQLRSVLLKVGADLLEGPTPQGVYTIGFSNIDGPREFTHALTELRKSGRVIFAEPTMATPVNNSTRR